MDPGAQGFFVRLHEEAVQALFLDNGAHPPKGHQSKIIGNWQVAPLIRDGISNEADSLG
jgi:hypothetical protein